MFGGPQLTEEQKKVQEQYANDTLKTAGVLAGVLWVAPIIIHFVKKQFWVTPLWN